MIEVNMTIQIPAMEVNMIQTKDPNYDSYDEPDFE